MYTANVGATAMNAIPIRMMEEKAPLLNLFWPESAVHGKLVVEMTWAVEPVLLACKLKMELVRALMSIGML